jgi:hypothetical protein
VCVCVCVCVFQGSGLVIGGFWQALCGRVWCQSSGMSEAECRPSRSTPGGYARFGAGMALCAGERGWIVE